MRISCRKLIQAVALAMFFVGFSTPSQAQSGPCSSPGTWSVGDPFAGVGHGTYLHYTNCGTDSSPNYVFVEAIAVFPSSDQTSGCAWDSQLNLYLTDTKSGLVAELNGISHVPVKTLTTGLSSTSVMFDSSGNLYVGNANVAGTFNAGVLKYVPTLPPNTSTGTFTYPTPPTTFNTGVNSDWIDLANDQNTLYFTGEGFVVQKEDLSTSTTSTFSTSTLNQAFAVRLLPPFDGTGGLLLADTANVVRLDSTGSIAKVYTFPNSTHLQALTLDPNGTSAWVADLKNGNVFRFNISTGTVEFTIPTPGGSSPNGVCVKGGPELNVVPLVYNVGTNVKATAGFGAPGTNNFHSWSATFAQVLQPFVLVLTATEGIDLGRFTDSFPNQAGCGGGLDCIGPQASTPTLTPIPYADQKAVVYRAANPPPDSALSQKGNLFIYINYTYPSAGGFYTPPTCPPPPGFKGNIAPVPDPRLFRAPSSETPPNIQFEFDSTTFTKLLDSGTGGTLLPPRLNDYNVADRCPSSAGSTVTFLSPLPKANVNLGSSLSIAISVVDASGKPIVNAVIPPNDITLSITQSGVPLTVFGVEGNSPDFFKITSNNKYKANLDTSSVQGLQLGPATLCITSIDTTTVGGAVGTATGPGEFPPACTTINLQ